MAIAQNFANLRPSLLLDFANTKQLDPRISFSRASTATFYNGVTTAMAEQNLLTYSEQFDNAIWTKTNTAVTANTTTAPDGTTTADSFNENTDVNQFHQIAQTFNIVGTLPNTWSVYLKANTRSNATLLLTSGGAFVFFAFDLSAGTVGAVQTSGSGWSSSTATITSVGNSWYRCTITSTYTTTGSCLAYIEINNGVTRQYNGNGSGIYVWGAQCEQRSAVTAYTATTTQAITNYIPVLQTAASGVARFDNNPTTGESLGLLIEESRTNLSLYSSDFTNGYYYLTNTTLSANSNVAPDGTQTAETLIENTATGNHQINIATVNNSSAAGAYTLSLYVKSASNRYFAMAFTDNVTGAFGSSSTYDLQLGTVTSGSGTITSVGNGWFRITTTGTKVNTAVNCGVQLYLVNSTGTTTSYTGNGWGGIFMWGLQVETGAFATSYIPTVASTVTRAADAASMTGTNFSSWFNVGQGTFYANASTEWVGGSVPQGGSRYFLNTTTTTGSTFTLYNNNLQNSITTYDGTNGVSTTVAAFSANNRFAMTYGNSVLQTAANGVSNSGTYNNLSYSGATSLLIGNANLGGWIKKVAYYPIAVTSAQLQALTS